ncbi:MAG: hypothetical protein HYX27_00015 [Acidobacteria bacterium]|nr:hypothetical protein [Acidobacteriota bacterium]
MPTQYNDIYVRDNFGDTGVIPSQGVPYQSPDIIPYGSNVLSVQTAISTYYSGPDIGQAISVPGLNNIFIRAKNLQQQGTETGSAKLFYAKSSLLMTPNQWTGVQTAGGSSSVNFVNQSNNPNLNPNDIALGQQAFLLTNLPPVQGDHYCMVAIVTTPNNNPTIPTSFPSNAAFSVWVQNNPAIGWRNISVVPSGQVLYSSTLQFGNLNATDGSFLFTITAPKGHNFAANTTVKIVSTDTRCPINWQGTLPPPDSNGNQIIAFENSIPAGFQGTLTATATSPSSQPFPPGAQLSVSFAQIQSSPLDPLELIASVHRPVPRYSPDGSIFYVNTMIIPIGECWFYVAS